MDNLTTVKLMIQPDTASDGLLLSLLRTAGEIILNRRYPFGYPEGTPVPVRYAQLQCRIAVELFSKMGAEGQTAHGENGITRTWEAADVSPSLLKQIIPMAGSVTNA